MLTPHRATPARLGEAPTVEPAVKPGGADRPGRHRPKRWPRLRAFVERCPEPGCGRRGCPGPGFHAANQTGWRR